MGQRPNELTPWASPFDLLGSEIRRRRTEQGLSLAELSKRVVYNASYLGKWERAVRQPTTDQVADIDRALCAAGALVRLREYAEQHADTRGQVRADVANHDLNVANRVAELAEDTVEPAAWDGDGMIAVPAIGPDKREIMVQVSRRMLLGGVGAAAVSSVTGTHPSMAVTSDSSVPAGVDPIAHFREIKLRLMDRDNLRGPAASISDAQKHLDEMEGYIQSARGDDRRALTEVRTQMADLAGWLYQDSGHWDGATYWLSQSIEMSHLVGDQQVTAFMLARRSQMYGEREDPQAALDAALAAVNMARTGSRIATVAHTFAGHAYALLGDATQSAQHYETAHTTVDRMEEHGPGAAYALFMCPAYLNSYHAHSLARLHNYATSAERFTTALTQLDPSMHRDRGVYTAWLAQSLSGAGEHDQAAKRGMEALAIAGGTGSARILAELRSLRDQLPNSNADATAFRSALEDLEEARES